MQKKAFISVLVLLGIVIVTVAVQRQRRQAQPPAPPTSVDAPTAAPAADTVAPQAAATPVPETITHVAPAERKMYEKAIEELQTKLEQKQMEAAAQGKADDVAAEAPLAGIAKALKDPAMRELMEVQQKAALDMYFSPLYDYLKLEGEDLDAFRQLLMERQMVGMDVGLSMMDGSLSAEERAEAVDNVKQAMDAVDARIKEFLGDESYTIYEEFQETQPERMQVQMFKQSLTPADGALDPQKEHDLIRAMYEERSTFEFTVDLQDQDSFDPSKLTEETVGTYIEEMERLRQQTMPRIREILDDAQFKRFEASQQQMRAMQEMGMKMAARMFQQAPQDAPAPQPEDE